MERLFSSIRSFIPHRRPALQRVPSRDTPHLVSQQLHEELLHEFAAALIDPAAHRRSLYMRYGDWMLIDEWDAGSFQIYNQLPVELMAHIFAFAVEGNRRFLATVTRVSSTWRKVAISTPCLWTAITVWDKASLAGAYMFLSRSKALPVHVELWLPRTLEETRWNLWCDLLDFAQIIPLSGFGSVAVRCWTEEDLSHFLSTCWSTSTSPSTHLFPPSDWAILGSSTIGVSSQPFALRLIRESNESRDVRVEGSSVDVGAILAGGKAYREVSLRIGKEAIVRTLEPVISAAMLQEMTIITPAEEDLTAVLRVLNAPRLRYLHLGITFPRPSWVLAIYEVVHNYNGALVAVPGYEDAEDISPSLAELVPDRYPRLNELHISNAAIEASAFASISNCHTLLIEQCPNIEAFLVSLHPSSARNSGCGCPIPNLKNLCLIDCPTVSIPRMEALVIVRSECHPLLSAGMRDAMELSGKGQSTVQRYTNRIVHGEKITSNFGQRNSWTDDDLKIMRQVYACDPIPQI